MLPNHLKMHEMIGQKQAKERASIMLAASQQRGEPPPHTLVYGASGLGKTEFVYALIAQMNPPQATLLTGADLNTPHVTAVEIQNGNGNGHTVTRNQKVDAVTFYVSQLPAGAVVFVDEIHAMNLRSQASLLVAMDRFIAGGKPVIPFTLIGATTDPGRMPPALRSRFKQVFRLTPYTKDEVADIIALHAKQCNLIVTKSSRRMLAKVCRSNMRVAVGLMSECADNAILNPDAELGMSVINDAIVQKVLANRGICEEEGLTTDDRDIMLAIGNSQCMSRESLARQVGLDLELIEESLDLLRQRGLAVQQPRGHALTDAGRQYLARQAERDEVN